MPVLCEYSDSYDNLYRDESMVGCIVQPITDSKICVESLKMMIIMTVIYFGCVNLNEVKKEKTEPETLNQACHF